MSSSNLDPEAGTLLACTVSRDVQNYDLLIEDMEAALGERWGDLGFGDALAFMTQPEAQTLEFIALAVDEEDEPNLVMLEEIIVTAKDQGIGVILIAEDVSAVSLHQLLRKGADEFVPYPLPEGELASAIERLRTAKNAPPEPEKVKIKPQGDREGVILPVHGLAGGVGSTTLAVNLAWELANMEDEPRVCLIDLDLQFGAVSTYLDLEKRDTVFELLSDTEAMDAESFIQALLTYKEKLFVLTAPAEVLPLDFIGPEDITRILEAARTNFDYVVIDMPSTLVQWTETVLGEAHVYFAPLELDLRSAQNALRMKRAMQSEELPFEKLRFALNRAPKFTDLTGKSRVKRMSESLGISIDLQLPDGGRQVVQSCDHGITLEESAAKNPLRKEIHKLAASLHNLNQSEGAAA